MRRLLIITVWLSGFCGFFAGFGICSLLNKTEPPEVDIQSEEVATFEPEIAIYECGYEMTPDDLEEELYYDSLELLACCVEAEAGNQPFEGKQLVVDVILNRVDHEDFPDNIADVIMQKLSNGVYQFSVVGDGRIFSVEPSEETFEAVRTELESRVNYEVLYFRTGRYSCYGEPYEKVGNHYFSK